jgi:MoaE-MoaD fusion protein
MDHQGDIVRVTVRLFAVVREKAGVGQTMLSLPSGSAVVDAAALLAQRFPDIVPHLSRAAFAINREYAAKDARLNDGDELAIIPPVSGG